MAGVGKGRGQNYLPPSGPHQPRGRGANYQNVGGGSVMPTRELKGGLPVNKYIKRDPISNTFKLYVKSIPPHFDHSSLTHLFSLISVPVSVFISGPQQGHPLQYGFVDYNTFAECVNAMKRINSNPISNGITCEFAKEKADFSQFLTDPEPIEGAEAPVKDWNIGGGAKASPLSIKMVVENNLPISASMNIKESVFTTYNHVELQSLIFKEVVKVDDEKGSKEKCAQCQFVGATRGCSACGTIYCSKDCMNKDQTRHNKLCVPTLNQDVERSGADNAKSRESLTNGFHNSSVKEDDRKSDSSFGNRSGRQDSFSNDRLNNSSDRFQRDNNNQQRDNAPRNNMFEMRKSRFENDRRRSDQGFTDNQGEARYQNRRSDTFDSRNKNDDSWATPKEVSEGQTQGQNSNQNLPLGLKFLDQEQSFSSKSCATPKTEPESSEQKNSFTTSTPKTDVVSSPKVSSSGLQAEVFQKVLVMVNEGQGVLYVQTEDQQKKAANIQVKLTLLDEEKPSPFSPVLDGVCVAKYEEMWSRCRVVSLRPLKVKYIDFGNVEDTVPDQLFTLPADLITIPPLVCKIKMANGTPEAFLKQDFGETINIKPVLKEGDTWTVRVEGVDYTTSVTPSRATVSTPATPSTPAAVATPTTPATPSTPAAVATPTTPATPSTPAAVATPTTPATATSKPATPVQQAPPKQLTPDVYNEVMIKHRMDNKITVTPLKLLPKLQAMTTKLQTLASSEDVVPPQMNMKCIVRSSTDKQWYRGRVVNINPLSVKLVDTGEVQVCSPNSVRSIPEEVVGVVPFVCTVQLKEETPKEILEKDIVSVKVLHQDPQTKAWVADVAPVSKAAGDCEASVKLSSETSVKLSPETSVKLSPETSVKPSPNKTTLTVQDEPEYPEIFTPGQFTTVMITSQDKDHQGNILYTVGPEDLLSRILEMHNFFEKDASRNVCLTVKPGAVGLHLNSDIWHRVRVTKCDPLTVYYLDYGTSEIVNSAEELRRCPETHKTCKRLIYRIQLAAGTDVKYHSLPEASELSVKPVAKLPDNTIIVHVENETYQDNIVPISSPSPVQPQQATRQTTEEFPTMLPADKFSSVVITFLDLSEKDAYFVGGPTVIDDYTATVMELNKEQATFQPFEPQVNDLCLALYDQMWNRGKVVSVSPLRVWFLDYGNTEDMQSQDLRKCPDHWAMEPLVCKIKLAPGTSTKWFGLKEEDKLNVKPVSKLVDGTVIVQVEGEVCVAEDVAAVLPVENKVSRTTAEPIVNLLQEGYKIDFFIHTISTRLHVFVGSLECINVPESLFFLKNSEEFDKCLHQAPKDPNFRPSEGQLIGLKFQDMWVRGVVVDKERNLVELLDCGQLAKYDEAVQLPDQFTSLPLLAAMFSMEDYSPELFDTMGSADLIEATVTSVDKEASGKVKSALVKTKEGVVGCVRPWRYNPLMHADPLNDGELVYITRYIDSRTLMVQRVEDLPVLQKIQIECDNSKSLKFDTPPRAGDFAVLLKSGDQAYCRVKIEEINSATGQCLLYDIDQGTTLPSLLSKLTPMTPSLEKIPCRAVVVTLYRVETKEVTDLYKTFVETLITSSEPLKVTFEEGMALLTLTQENQNILIPTKNNKNINEVLQSFLQEKLVVPVLDMNDKYTLGSLPIPCVPMNQVVTVTPSQTDPLYLQISSVVEEYFSMNVNHEINSLKSEDIQMYCQATTAYAPAHNELCLARYPEDDSFYRCQCVREPTKDTPYALQLIDFGNFFHAHAEDIRQIPEMFLKHPVFGFPSELVGVSEGVKTEILPKLQLYSNHTVMFRSVNDQGKYAFEYIASCT